MGGIPAKNLIQGFGRLKGIFRSGINYRTYSQICGTAKRQVVGNLPKDMLSRLISGGTKTAKRDAIIGVQNAFEQAAKVLSEQEKHAQYAINKIPTTFETFLQYRTNQVNGITEKVGFSFDEVLASGSMTEVRIRAEEALLKGIKPYIPEANNVIITPLGGGGFGVGYRVEVLNRGRQKIFSDKVLKVFYKKGIDERYSEKISKVVKSLSDEELLKAYKMADPESTATIEEIRQYFSKPEQLSQFFQRSHGCLAEANITEYLRGALRVKSGVRQGIVLPDMHNVGENPFAISEFVQETGTMPAAKRFRFRSYALEYTDMLNLGNYIDNTILIDIGGVTPLSDMSLERSLSSKIVGNKTGLKIYKLIDRTPAKQRREVLADIGDNIFATPARDRIEQLHRELSYSEIEKIFNRGCIY